MACSSAEEIHLMATSPKLPKTVLPVADDCTHTPFYCEENVWKLCAYVKDNSPEHLQSCYVIFISNADKTIPLWRQKASKNENGLVVWDYHVIFLLNQDEETRIYDLDSTLPFPCDINSYAPNTFRSDNELKQQFHRMFRVVPAVDFLQTFASDRSHMKNNDGKWLKPPPSYSCIQLPNETNNLSKFISMDKCSPGFGEVLTLDQFIHRFQVPIRTRTSADFKIIQTRSDGYNKEGLNLIPSSLSLEKEMQPQTS